MQHKYTMTLCIVHILWKYSTSVYWCLGYCTRISTKLPVYSSSTPNLKQWLSIIVWVGTSYKHWYLTGTSDSINRSAFWTGISYPLPVWYALQTVHKASNQERKRVWSMRELCEQTKDLENHSSCWQWKMDVSCMKILPGCSLSASAFLLAMCVRHSCKQTCKHSPPLITQVGSNVLIGQFLNCWHVTYHTAIYRVRYSLPFTVFDALFLFLCSLDPTGCIQLKCGIQEPKMICCTMRTLLHYFLPHTVCLDTWWTCRHSKEIRL